MAVDDRTRLNLLRKLEAVLGVEEANTLMEHLPPITWNEIATKDDLRTGVERLETSFRGDMAQLDTSLRSDMAQLETSLRSEMQVGFAGLRTEFVEASNRQIKWLVTFAAAWSSVLVAVVGVVR